jgi:hypothetical protein
MEKLLHDVWNAPAHMCKPETITVLRAADVGPVVRLLIHEQFGDLFVACTIALTASSLGRIFENRWGGSLVPPTEHPHLVHWANKVAGMGHEDVIRYAEAPGDYEEARREDVARAYGVDAVTGQLAKLKVQTADWTPTPTTAATGLWAHTATIVTMARAQGTGLDELIAGLHLDATNMEWELSRACSIGDDHLHGVKRGTECVAATGFGRQGVVDADGNIGEGEGAVAGPSKRPRGLSDEVLEYTGDLRKYKRNSGDDADDHMFVSIDTEGARWKPYGQEEMTGVAAFAAVDVFRDQPKGADELLEHVTVRHDDRSAKFVGLPRDGRGRTIASIT